MATAGTRRAQREETELALKRAAVAVFGRVGYLNAKITDITAEAGRAAGSFYSHFPNKEALLEALLTDLLDAGDDLAMDPAHSGDFTDRAAVRYHVAGYWTFYKHHFVLMTALQQAATVDERFAERARELMEPDLHHLAEHLEQVRDAGVRLPGEPVVVAALMRAAMVQFAQFWIGEGGVRGQRLTDDEAVETITAFIYGGIGNAPR
jgi:AcrR family transcriptional regulator